MEKDVDYCLKCDSLPCEIHYKCNHPYSDFLLDMPEAVKECRDDIDEEESLAAIERVSKKHRKSRHQSKTTLDLTST